MNTTIPQKPARVRSDLTQDEASVRCWSLTLRGALDVVGDLERMGAPLDRCTELRRQLGLARGAVARLQETAGTITLSPAHLAAAREEAQRAVLNASLSTGGRARPRGRTPCASR